MIFLLNISSKPISKQGFVEHITPHGKGSSMLHMMGRVFCTIIHIRLLSTTKTVWVVRLCLEVFCKRDESKYVFQEIQSDSKIFFADIHNLPPQQPELNAIAPCCACTHRVIRVHIKMYLGHYVLFG